MTKSFVVLAVIFILVGGSIGGAFTGGVILGRSQAENEAPAAANLGLPEGFAGQAAALQQIARQLPQGGAEGQDLATLRERFAAAMEAGSDLQTPVSPGEGGEIGGDEGEASEFPALGRGLGIFGGGAAFGTIDSINDGVVLLDTPQGQVRVSTGTETEIRVFSTGALDDLEEGMSVTVMGQEDGESGNLEAVSIIALPEGAGAFPGLGGGLNRPQGGRRP